MQVQGRDWNECISGNWTVASMDRSHEVLFDFLRSINGHLPMGPVIIDAGGIGLLLHSERNTRLHGRATRDVITVRNASEYINVTQSVTSLTVLI